MIDGIWICHRVELLMPNYQTEFIFYSMYNFDSIMRIARKGLRSAHTVMLNVRFTKLMNNFRMECELFQCGQQRRQENWLVNDKIYIFQIHISFSQLLVALQKMKSNQKINYDFYVYKILNDCVLSVYVIIMFMCWIYPLKYSHCRIHSRYYSNFICTCIRAVHVSVALSHSIHSSFVKPISKMFVFWPYTAWMLFSVESRGQ